MHVRRVDGGEIKNLKLKLPPRWISVYAPEEPQASSGRSNKRAKTHYTSTILAKR